MCTHTLTDLSLSPRCLRLLNLLLWMLFGGRSNPVSSQSEPSIDSRSLRVCRRFRRNSAQLLWDSLLMMDARVFTPLILTLCSLIHGRLTHTHTHTCRSSTAVRTLIWIKNCNLWTKTSSPALNCILMHMQTFQRCIFQTEREIFLLQPQVKTDKSLTVNKKLIWLE